MGNLLEQYEKQKIPIEAKLKDFKSLDEKEYINELIFCLLTPQSNAKKCWQAVEQIRKLSKLDQKSIVNILKTKTRFHNNKSSYILHNLQNWRNIKSQLNNPDKKNIKELRNWLAKNVKGLGYKESSHFLRNIGKSNNQIAILDRHILRNLKARGIIKEEKIKSNKHYLQVEDIFLNFANSINIPADHLDLLFWSSETGEIFK